MWFLPKGCSSSRSATLQVLSMEYSLSGTDCSSMGPPQVTAPARKLDPVWHPLHRPHFLPEAYFPCTPASFRAHPSAAAWGPPQAAGWISAPPWTSVSCRGTSCITIVFTMGCRRIAAPVPGAPRPPPSSPALVSAGLFLSYSHSPVPAAVFHPF